MGRSAAPGYQIDSPVSARAYLADKTARSIEEITAFEDVGQDVLLLREQVAAIRPALGPRRNKRDRRVALETELVEVLASWPALSRPPRRGGEVSAFLRETDLGRLRLQAALDFLQKGIVWPLDLGDPATVRRVLWHELQALADRRGWRKLTSTEVLAVAVMIGLDADAAPLRQRRQRYEIAPKSIDRAYRRVFSTDAMRKLKKYLKAKQRIGTKASAQTPVRAPPKSVAAPSVALSPTSCVLCGSSGPLVKNLAAFDIRTQNVCANCLQERLDNLAAEGPFPPIQTT